MRAIDIEGFTQECLDEMTHVSYSLTKVMSSNSTLSMRQC